MRRMKGAGKDEREVVASQKYVPIPLERCDSPGSNST
jgi:hypothetical protein